MKKQPSLSLPLFAEIILGRLRRPLVVFAYDSLYEVYVRWLLIDEWWMESNIKFNNDSFVEKKFLLFFYSFIYLCYQRAKASLVNCEEFWLASSKDIFITVNLLFILQLSFWNSFCLLDRLYVYLIYTCVRICIN